MFLWSTNIGVSYTLHYIILIWLFVQLWSIHGLLKGFYLKGSSAILDTGSLIEPHGQKSLLLLNKLQQGCIDPVLFLWLSPNMPRGFTTRQLSPVTLAQSRRGTSDRSWSLLWEEVNSLSSIKCYEVHTCSKIIINVSVFFFFLQLVTKVITVWANNRITYRVDWQRVLGAGLLSLLDVMAGQYFNIISLSSWDFDVRYRYIVICHKSLFFKGCITAKWCHSLN